VNSFWIRRTLLIKDGFASNCEMNLFCDHKITILIFHYRLKYDYIKYIEVDRTSLCINYLYIYIYILFFLLKLTLKIIIILWSMNHAIHQFFKDKKGLGI